MRRFIPIAKSRGFHGTYFGKEDDDPKFERLKKFRSLRNQNFILLFKTDSATKEIEELETKDEVQLASVKAREFITSKDFLSQKFDTPKLQELKSKLLFEIEEVNRWKRSIISQHDAEEKAKLEYMTPAEREILAQTKQLENFLLTLKKPDESPKDAMNAYEETVSSVNSKIGLLLISAASLKKTVDEINNKLEKLDFKKNILLVQHQILQSNSYARKMLKMESEKLDRAVDDLKDAIFYQSISDKKYFKTREVFNILRHQYFTLKKYEQQLELKYSYKTAASLIADAILREAQAAQLVARSTGNNLEMDKTWELMTDLDKDEILHQKIFREL